MNRRDLEQSERWLVVAALLTAAHSWSETAANLDGHEQRRFERQAHQARNLAMVFELAHVATLRDWIVVEMSS